MNEQRIDGYRGRGSAVAPTNRFLPICAEQDEGHLEYERSRRTDDEAQSERCLRTEFVADESKTIVTQNQSPDVGFRYSVNPYRGCEHGCAYCYARPTHEYLGLSAGLDFESKIFVKHRAPELFREWLARDDWQPQGICFSGVTDCYQPAERRFRLTRGCLQVALQARQPVSIVTKNALVTRDVDILAPMAAEGIVNVAISLTTLDMQLARTMEPRTSPPAARLRAINVLDRAGVPVRAMLAPIIPGLNDAEIPALLSAVKKAGAAAASYILLRLPLSVRPVFLDWLERTLPTKQARIVSLVRSTRQGKLNDAQFGRRMSGTGEIAEQIRNTFEVFARKHRLDRPLPPLETSQFRPPQPRNGQRRLF